MNDIDKEKDVDMEEVRRICSEKTAEELDAEFEAFKKEFAEKHKQEEIQGNTEFHNTAHEKKHLNEMLLLHSNAVFSGKVFCYSGFAGECSSRTIAFSTQCCRTLRMRIRYPSISSFRRLPSFGISPSLPMRKPLKVSYSSASENS